RDATGADLSRLTTGPATAPLVTLLHGPDGHYQPVPADPGRPARPPYATAVARHGGGHAYVYSHQVPGTGQVMAFTTAAQWHAVAGDLVALRPDQSAMYAFTEVDGQVRRTGQSELPWAAGPEPLLVYVPDVDD